MATIREMKDQERDIQRDYTRPPYRSFPPIPQVQRPETAPTRQTNPYGLFSDYDLWFIYNMMQDQWYWYGVHFTDRGYDAFIRNFKLAEDELKRRGMIR